MSIRVAWQRNEDSHWKKRQECRFVIFDARLRLAGLPNDDYAVLWLEQRHLQHTLLSLIHFNWLHRPDHESFMHVTSS